MISDFESFTSFDSYHVASDMPRDGGASSRCSKDDETCTMTHAPAVEEEDDEDDEAEGTPWYRERLWRMAQPAHDGTPSSSACIQLPPRGTPERAEAVHTFNAFFRKDRANAQLALSKSRCHMATRHNRPEHLETLIFRQREDFNKPDLEGLAPIHIAAREGYDECLRILIRAKATVDDADNSGQTPILYAVNKGHAACLKMLIDAGGIRHELKIGGILHIAAMRGHVKCIEILINAGANVDISTGRKTPMHSAAKFGHATVVQMLIDAGADVNAKDDYGKRTPMHIAAFNGHATVVQMLIDAGADVNAKDDYGKRTPVHVAAFNGQATALQMLIDAGADINAQDDEKNPPMHFAAAGGHATTLKMLIDAGADINAHDDEKCTPCTSLRFMDT